MASLDDDVRSQASWAVLSDANGRVMELDSWDDARSDVSLDCGQSDASWDMLSVRSATQFSLPGSVRFFDAAAPTEATAESVAKDQAQLLKLAYKQNWTSALNLLRTCGAPDLVAAACDSDGDSVLSWIAYKAGKGASRPELLELLCAVLALSPSHASKRSKRTKFLPLHDAAWGGAKPAVAYLICMAHPHALFDRASKESPHEVFEYYHRRSTGSWPSAESMQDACGRFSSSVSWRTVFEAVGFPEQPTFETATDRVRRLLGDLLSSVLDDFLHGSLHGGLFSIPEQHGIQDTEGACQRTRPLRYYYNESSTANLSTGLSGPLPCHPIYTPPVWRKHGARLKKLVPRGRCLAPVETLPLDEVEFLREACARGEVRRSAGRDKARNTRCGFSATMAIEVGSGVRHHLKLHVARTLWPSFQIGPGCAKWPSKMANQRERQECRRLKVYFRDMECNPDLQGC
eukprot:TRINITY_DN82468_c0_g1_i1.p1 TRINITY_DN82468_c0_g1~~TRINITY_DN82468_c0_g1_i1.p1  ORF type:complete len:460 (-),score=78.45 TRINITY_DN82468_c0_g1_i1:244-1623(-)